MLRRLIALLRPTRRELQEAAITRACNLRGEYEACKLQQCYYDRLQARTDPWTDWWTFAQVRQKYVEAAEEQDIAWQRYQKARADVEALLEQK